MLPKLGPRRAMLDANLVTELVAVLEWYRAMGADEAAGDAPIDWLERGDRAPGNGFERPSSPQHSARPQVAFAAAPPVPSHPAPRPTPSIPPPPPSPPPTPPPTLMPPPPPPPH